MLGNRRRSTEQRQQDEVGSRHDSDHSLGSQTMSRISGAPEREGGGGDVDSHAGSRPLPELRSWLPFTEAITEAIDRFPEEGKGRRGVA